MTTHFSLLYLIYIFSSFIIPNYSSDEHYCQRRLWGNGQKNDQWGHRLDRKRYLKSSYRYQLASDQRQWDCTKTGHQTETKKDCSSETEVAHAWLAQISKIIKIKRAERIAKTIRWPQEVWNLESLEGLKQLLQIKKIKFYGIRDDRNQKNYQ